VRQPVVVGGAEHLVAELVLLVEESVVRMELEVRMELAELVGEMEMGLDSRPPLRMKDEFLFNIMSYSVVGLACLLLLLEGCVMAVDGFSDERLNLEPNMCRRFSNG